MEFQCRRAREYFRSGFQLLPYLSPQSRPCPAVLGQLYRRVLDRIEDSGYDVLHHRASLSAAEKLWVMATTWTSARLSPNPR
jgi:phytoene/squalene synthetase